MFLDSAGSCLHKIYWSQMFSGEWRWSWSNTDRRCSNYIWVINNFIAYSSAPYIRHLTVSVLTAEIKIYDQFHTQIPNSPERQLKKVTNSKTFEDINKKLIICHLKTSDVLRMSWNKTCWMRFCACNWEECRINSLAPGKLSSTVKSLI